MFFVSLLSRLDARGETMNEVWPGVLRQEPPADGDIPPLETATRPSAFFKGHIEGAGAPDEMLMLSRSALVEGMVAELLEFFYEPRASGSVLHESEARWIVAGGMRRAKAGS